MKTLIRLAGTLLLVCAFATEVSAQSAQHVTRASGDPMKLDVGYHMTGANTQVGLNLHSALRREWITIHNNSMPADIVGTVGIKISYGGDLYYDVTYQIEARETITAFEIRFLAFDIWGDFMKTFSVTEIIDMDAGRKSEFGMRWIVIPGDEVEQYYASIAYIAQVRTADGKIIKPDLGIVLKEAMKFSEEFSESDLEP